MTDRINKWASIKLHICCIFPKLSREKIRDVQNYFWNVSKTSQNHSKLCSRSICNWHKITQKNSLFYKEFYMPLTSSFGFFSGKSSLVPFKQKLQLKKENFFRKLLRKSRQVFGVKYVNSKVHFDKVLKKLPSFIKKKAIKKAQRFL